MSRNREHVLTAITAMVLIGMLGTWWHVTGDCGRAPADATFTACQRIEDNESLISVGALLLALALALIEFRRANDAEARARKRATDEAVLATRQHIEAVCRLSEMLSETVDVCRTKAEGWPATSFQTDWLISNSGRDAAEALRILAKAASSRPELMVGTLGVARIADMAAQLDGQTFQPNGWRAWYDTIQRNLERETEVVRDLKPPAS